MKILPIFLPQMGCINKCVFCDQRSTTGSSKVPDLSQLDELAKDYRLSLGQFEIAFYGGTFTGLDETLQLLYLDWANKYVKDGACVGIRISTRPDQIDERKIEFLKAHNVTFIEMGVQSFDDEVLKRSYRGHTVRDIENACKILKDTQMDFGLHLMVGLPADDEQKDLYSAWRVVESGAKTCRIHPTLVLRDSILSQFYAAGEYEPLEINRAIDICSKMVGILQSRGVKVIRIGLFIPSDLEKNIVAGPYHPRFGELVKIDLMKKVVSYLKPDKIFYTPKQRGLLRAVNLQVQMGEEFGFLVSGRFLKWKDALAEYISGGVQDVRTAEKGCSAKN